MVHVKPIPDGAQTVTSSLVVRGAKQAIEFYKAAFGAKELGVFYMPDGVKVMHAEIQIGDTKLYLTDEYLEMGARSPQAIGGSSVSFNIYTEDCDALFKRAVTAGAKVEMPLADQFWGDRYGRVTDPFGHAWAIMTHKEDVSRDEMTRRMKEAMATSDRH